MINAEMIKNRMATEGLRQTDIAAALGLANPTVSQKINGVRPMNLDEARKIAELLHIDAGEFGAYFFAQ